MPTMRWLGAAFLVLLFACDGEVQEGAAPETGPREAVVAVGQTRAGGLEAEWRLFGRVRALARARLSAAASGEVSAVHVREGDRVARGDLLVEIDRSVVSAQLQAAVAEREQGSVERELAESDAERLNRAGARLVPGAEIEQAEFRAEALAAQHQRLRATVREARAEVAQRRIVAPFDGVVVGRDVDPGDFINIGDATVELVSDAGVEIIVDAPQDLVTHLQSGHPAILHENGQSVAAQVVGVVRALDEITRTAPIRIVPSENPPWLMAGATVDVTIAVLRDAESAVVIPRDALVFGAVGQRVVRVVDGKAVPVDVEVLARSQREILVRGEGLEAGQVIVTRGNERLRPEQPVRVQGG